MRSKYISKEIQIPILKTRKVYNHKVNTYLKNDSDIHLIKEESWGRGAKRSQILRE